MIPASMDWHWIDSREQSDSTDRGKYVIGIQMCRFPRSWIITVLIPATVDQYILTPTKRATLSDRSDSKF